MKRREGSRGGWRPTTIRTNTNKEQRKEHQRTQKDNTTTNMSSELKTVRLHVGGMSCVTCTRTVAAALNAISGVESSEVNALAETALVTLKKNETVPSHALVDAVEAVGFTAAVPEDPSTTGDRVSGQAVDRMSVVEEMEQRRLREVLEWKTRFLLCSIFTLPCFLLAMVFPM